MRVKRRQLRRLATGLAFLAPNILGFLTFTLVPLVISFVMAFTNWDVHLHNIFRDESVRFVGLENFRRLLSEPDFGQYLGNTFYFMLGIPFAMAGSLVAALLLSQDLRSRAKSRWVRGVCVAVLIAGLAMLVVAGLGGTATVLLLTAVGGFILIAGRAGGQTVYRTMFYSPAFTAGVAVFLLWKKLYSPHNGPINNALAPVLDHIEGLVNALPAPVVQGGAYACALLLALLLGWAAQRLSRAWRDGEAGLVSLALSALILLGGGVSAVLLAPTAAFAVMIAAALVLAVVLLAVRCLPRRPFRCVLDYGLSTSTMLAGAVAAAGFVLLGLSHVLLRLPAMSAEGLTPPEWLARYHWAKPAIMIMGLWAAVGSNNMLLYLAGLSNIPVELNEAADIDGASRLQKFLHVTWPQLAPITFFIFIMSVIGGLQGGFEMARTMTRGGPAGSTTTLSYYIYTEGFEAGRLGYASAVAWALFVMVFGVTLINWKLGNRYTND